MADLPVTNNPEFSATMSQITTQDWGAPETFNPRYQVLLDNDNYLNAKTDRMRRTLVVTLSAAGWSASAPYTQTVNVAGITASDNPVVSLYLPEGITSADVKLQSKAYGYVDDGDIIGLNQKTLI